MAVTKGIMSPANLPSVAFLVSSITGFITGNITASNVADSLPQLVAAQQTLTNTLHILDAYELQTYLTQEAIALGNALSGPVHVSPSDLAFVTKRLAAMGGFVGPGPNSVYPLSIWIDFDINNIFAGAPAVEPYDLLGYFMSFCGTTNPVVNTQAEAPPLGITTANFMDNALASANAWQNVLTSISGTGTILQKTAYDAVNRMYQSSIDTYNLLRGSSVVNVGAAQILSAFEAGTTATIVTDVNPVGLLVGEFVTISGVSVAGYNGTFVVTSIPTNDSFTYTTVASGLAVGSGGIASIQASNLVFAINFDASILWTALVALPSILRDGALLINNPSNRINQASNSIKYLILTLIEQLNAVIATFSVPNRLPQPILAQLKVSFTPSGLTSCESLMDFAARTTGDFEQWSVIAAINNLQPPYVGIMKAPGIATPGQFLYLPPGPPSGAQPIANYETAFLGTDINLGQPGTDLIVWNGDFTTISGYANFAYALIRRILTPLGSLVFHGQYGSLLPAQVGDISTASEARFLVSLLSDTVLGDPRTASVDRTVATAIGQGQVLLKTWVTPFGGNHPPTPVGVYIVPRIPQ